MKKKIEILSAILSLIGIILAWNIIFVQAKIYTGIQQAELDYDNEVELEYGVPTLISEVSVPPGNIFGGQIIGGLYLKANFSNNNGSIWINDQNNETIWIDYLIEIIEKDIDVNSSSIRRYSLWANSSTLGNETLYFTFSAMIFHAENFGLGVLIVFLPIIICTAGGSIIYKIKHGKTKESSSVRFAKRVGERLAIKYEDKYQKKVEKIFGDKFKKREKKLCPKCGFRIKDQNYNFCKECGFKLKE